MNNVIDILPLREVGGEGGLVAGVRVALLQVNVEFEM